MTTNAYPGPRPDRVTAQHKRDAAFRRLTRVRTITIAGASALTAVVSGVVSSAAGHTLGATHASRHATGTRRAPAPPTRAATLPPLASAGQLGLRPPGAAPQPVPNAVAQAPAPPAQPVAPPSAAPQPAPGPVVSGGS